MAALGHQVIGVDTDAAKVASLSAAEAPFFEPGLQELLFEGIESGRLRFTSDPAEAAAAGVHFVAVGTPEGPDGAVDLSAVESVFASLPSFVKPGDLVVGKSTVPVGTAARLAPALEAIGARLACNPEFLREGFAVRDSLAPDRIVFGVRPSDVASVKMLEEIYAGVDDSVPRMTTDYATAEMIKVAANAFLATKISFINAMAEFAEAVDADVVQLAVALGHDPRIGHRFLKSGLGFGGGCLPKDIRGFMASAEEIGVGESLAFLREVDAINRRRRERVVQLTIDACGGDVRGRRIGILGLAFKPDSDDVRDSPALHVADALSAMGADVVATDPHARATAGAMSPHLTIVARPLDAIDGADVVLVLTDWSEYSGIDPVEAARRVATPIVIDARNCLDPVRWRDAGWRYVALGRPDGAL